MIGLNGEIKIADFGWSVYTPPKNKRKTFCGTLDYLAPEIVNRDEYDNSIDIWCLGVLMYEFLMGSPPFESESQKITQSLIVKGEFSIPEFLSEEAKDLLTKFLKNKPKDRIQLKDVVKHPWIVKYAKNCSDF